MGRSSNFVAAGFGVVAALLATDATALDCAALTKSTRTINITVTATTNGAPSQMRNFRIERGAHTLITALAANGSVLFRNEGEGVLGRWAESYSAGKLLRQDIEYVNVRGPLASLEEGATSTYELRSTANGNVIFAAEGRQTVGPHGSTRLSGCTVATVAVHREVLQRAKQVRTTMDQVFAPELGYFVMSTTKRESASPEYTRTYTFSAISAEVEE